MRRKIGYRPAIVTAFLAALICLAPARAAEIVTLRNGFEMRCDHHALDGARVRLYLTAGDDNYIELPPAQIEQVQAAPDPAPSQVPRTPDSSAPDQALPDQAMPGLAEPANSRLTHADLAEMLAAAGRAHHLDVDLLASLVNAESGGNPRAVSRAGAQGLMQLMPTTASELGVTDSFQPSQNVRGGSAYLDALLTRYNNNLALALAAYNAGPQAVARYHGIPPYAETRAYVARVIHEFNRRILARERTRQSSARHPG